MSNTDAIHSIIAAEVALFKTPLNTFLTALQQPGVNTQSVVQDYIQNLAGSVSLTPQAESIVISGTAAALQAQLNAAPVVSPATAAAVAALPAA